MTNVEVTKNTLVILYIFKAVKVFFKASSFLKHVRIPSREIISSKCSTVYFTEFRLHLTETEKNLNIKLTLE